MARKRKGTPIHGWLVLDKPPALTSAKVVAIVRRHLDAAKAGHGGTLDPLATGILPIAFGEATKTVAYAMERRKTYRFVVRWGEARATDDVTGELLGDSAVRPTAEAIRAALATFTGAIAQVPPAYSAIQVAGRRAYARARAGESLELAPRGVVVHRLSLEGLPDRDHALFEVVCGKGTYVRSLARDLGVTLGTLGCIAELRRLAVGPFTENQAISLDYLTSLGHDAVLAKHLLPVETGLDDIPALALTEEEAARLRHGQIIPMLGDDHHHRQAHVRAAGSEQEETLVCAMSEGRPVAVARLAGGKLRALRVLNL
ncbi:MAG: tRNA pseudouridine(55) synthase TruB [Pseudomonadota bacterium]